MRAVGYADTFRMSCSNSAALRPVRNSTRIRERCVRSLERERYERDPPHMPLSRPFPQVILVVEDEALIRASLAEYLRDCGYQVFEADSVSEATSVLGNGTPVDLVFTDVNLVGDENGFMLAHWVHQNRPTTKVLLTSGTAYAAKVCEDDPIVMKPYGYSGVVQRIHALLPPLASSAPGVLPSSRS